MATKTYVITPGGNTVVSGQQVILDGIPQFTGNNVIPPNPQLATTGKHKTVILNGTIPDSWQSGDDFEITNLVTNNTLNASFVGLGFREVNPGGVSGIQLINLALGEHDVTVDGAGANFVNGLPLFTGLNTLTLKSSQGGWLTFGSEGSPLQVPLSNIVAMNAPIKGSGIEVNIAASVFNPATPVNFTFSNVGGAGTHQSESDDYVHGSRDVFSAGYAGGGTTANTWNLKVTGSNFVELFTHGATNTNDVEISGSGSLTLFGVDWQFANVTKINDTATGAQVITGALQEDGASKSYTGFLAENSVLSSLNVVGNAGNFIDLSGFESLTGFTTLKIGAGTVVLDDDVLLSLSTSLPTGGIQGGVTNIGWGGEDGSGPGESGTIDWSFLPSSANKLTFYHGVDANGTLSVINAPNSFTMNLQDENFHHNNFVITAANTTSLTTTLTLDLGNAVTNEGPRDINENWSVNGYSTVNIVLAGDDDIHLGSEGGFFVNPNGGPALINISGATTDNNEMHFGNLNDANIFDYLDFNQLPVLAANGVLTQAGSIVDTAKTFLELGVTDATSINAATGGGLFMDDPTTSIFQTLHVTGSTGTFNNLQGSLGDVSFFSVDGFFDFDFNNSGGLFGIAGKAVINGGTHGDNIWDTGGTETINLANLVSGHSDTINYSQFQLNGSENDSEFAFTIADNEGGYTNNNLAGPGVATVNNYNATADDITFNDDSWGHGSGADFGPAGTYEGLVDTQGNHPETANGVFQVVLPSGVLPATNGSGDAINIVVFDPLVAHTDLMNSINSGGGGFTTTGAFTVGDTYSMIFAYNNGAGTELADVQFDVLTTGAFHVDHVQNLMNIVGVGASATAGTIHFVT